MVGEDGFEPPACALGVRRSILLSYSPMVDAARIELAAWCLTHLLCQQSYAPEVLERETGLRVSATLAISRLASRSR